MHALPRVERDGVSIPVPWFVAWQDGAPEFRAMDPQRFAKAIRQRLCWVCGQKLGVHFAFVAGPMCGINRTSSEPPCHADCARWSAQNCPFLATPRMVRREDGLADGVKENVAGFAIRRNPGVAMLWFTREYEVFRVPEGAGAGWLIQMGEPDKVEWWREGREATRAEVMESIETGLPNLEAIARTEQGGIAALQAARQRFERYLPTSGFVASFEGEKTEAPVPETHSTPVEPDAGERLPR
jgi:hypothetical protein